MSAGECSQPSSMNSAIALLAQPLDVERPARHEMPQPLEPLRRADQAAGAADVDLAFLGDRLATGIPGNGRGRRRRARFSSRVRFSTTCGMTSPARWMRTRSPTRRPSRAISSRLCSVTLATITPPTPTGFSRPTGVSLPVRPTWMSIASSVVSAFSAGNLCARPQRGARADLAEPLLPVEPADLVDHAVDVERQVGARLLDRAHNGRALRRPSRSASSRSLTGNAEALDPLHRLRTAVAPSGSLTSPQP